MQTHPAVVGDLVAEVDDATNGDDGEHMSVAEGVESFKGAHFVAICVETRNA